MAADKKNIQVGLRSGQVLSLKLEESEFKALLAAIKKSGDDWHTVKDDKREIEIRPAQVDFYAIDGESEETHVGF